ncbi:MAG TPA: hypothetical protein VJP06_05600, partial [Thermoplasmata archaeon]|nr:hypothetical protein [Thermoplasmata archaeon]
GKQYQASVGQDPTGLSVLVDNVSYTSVATFWWNESSVHALEAPSPQYASPDVREVWASWSDGGARAHTVTANAPFSATASFFQEQGLFVSTSPVNLAFTMDGTTYTAATTFWFASGTYHIVSVQTTQSGSPGVRYQFSSWSDGGNATHVVLFTAATTLQASFAPEYYLTVTSPVPGATGSGWFAAGASTTATVSNAIYVIGVGQQLVFRGWRGDASGTGLTSNAIVMNGPKEAVADYGTQYYLEVSSAYAATSGAGWYDAGSNAYAQVSATNVSLGSGTRELFEGWTGDAVGSTATSHAILMDAAKVATAQWKTQYRLTILTDHGVAVGGGWYDQGSNAVASLQSGTVLISTGTRAVFAGWSGDARGSTPSSNPILMSGPKTAIATWTTEYLVTVTSDYGSVEGGGWYAAGARATLQAPGQVTSGGQTYTFAGWTGDVTSGDATVTVTVDHPITAHATWSSPGALGTISGTTWGLVSALVVIAVIVALAVWRRSRGRGK